MRATWPIQLILLDLATVKAFDEGLLCVVCAYVYASFPVSNNPMHMRIRISTSSFSKVEDYLEINLLRDMFTNTAQIVPCTNHQTLVLHATFHTWHHQAF
jgi:hypothetical protein